MAQRIDHNRPHGAVLHLADMIYLPAGALVLNRDAPRVTRSSIIFRVPATGASPSAVPVLPGCGSPLPEPLAGMLADSDKGASTDALCDDGHQVSTLVGRKTTPIAEAIGHALAQ